MTDGLEPDRAHWEERWRGTLWEIATGGQWRPLGERSAEVLVALSAWNPLGDRLPVMVNRARDRVLAEELRAMGLSPMRVRGRSRDHAWCEEGWQIPHDEMRTTALLARFGQIAGLITGPSGARYAWAPPPG